MGVRQWEMGRPAWRGLLAAGTLTLWLCPPPVPGADPEEVLVYDTDYTTFALMLSRRQSGSREIDLRSQGKARG